MIIPQFGTYYHSSAGLLCLEIVSAELITNPFGPSPSSIIVFIQYCYIFGHGVMFPFHALGSGEYVNLYIIGGCLTIAIRGPGSSGGPLFRPWLFTNRDLIPGLLIFFVLRF